MPYSLWLPVVLFVLFLVLILVLRVVWILAEIWKGRRTMTLTTHSGSGFGTHHRRQRTMMKTVKYPVKTLIILGSGGHTTEMLFLTKHLDPEYYHPILFCKAATDETSIQRLSRPQRETQVYDIPRSREVGQSYLSSIVSTCYAFLVALQLVGSIRPDLILTNGPGTALPVCVAAFVYRVLGYGYPSTRIIFIESFCRVRTLSLTGILLYYWVDLFVVHWDELQRKYPSSRRIRTLVPTLRGEGGKH